MFNLGFEAFATFIIIVAPIAVVLFLIALVVAYPWLLLVPLGIWYLSIKYGQGGRPDPRKDSENTPADGETAGRPASESAPTVTTVMS